MLSKFDANTDGKLDFEEFALWFLETWNALKKQGGILCDDGDKGKRKSVLQLQIVHFIKHHRTRVKHPGARYKNVCHLVIVRH